MIYDISFPLSPETMVYPGDPPFLQEVLLDGAKGDDCTLSLLHLGSHLGTHIDFPRHFFPHGMDAASFPLEQLCGACKVFSIPCSILSIWQQKQVNIWRNRRLPFWAWITKAPKGTGIFPFTKHCWGGTSPYWKT